MPPDRRDPLKALKYAAAALAVVGAAIMGYLTYLHFEEGASSVCDLSEQVSCSIVNTSPYSELLGVPVAVFGIIYFLLILGLLVLPDAKDRFQTVAAATAFSLAFSLYLSGIELFVLDSICLFCEGSKVVMLAILALALAAAYQQGEKPRVRWLVGGALAGIALSIGAWFLQTPVTSADYAPLAQCLTEKHVAMFGAYWCPQCAKEKDRFGDAFARIDYIECDPRGENAQTERCVEHDVKKTPTWIQLDDEGGEVKRVAGFQGPARLAETFGCEEALP